MKKIAVVLFVVIYFLVSFKSVEPDLWIGITVIENDTLQRSLPRAIKAQNKDEALLLYYKYVHDREKETGLKRKAWPIDVFKVKPEDILK